MMPPTVSLTPTGEEDDEAEEMVRGSQGRKSSDQQVSFEHDLAKILSTSTFQTMPPTVDGGRKSSASSDQVRLKCEAARINIFRADINFLLFRQRIQQMRKMRRRC